MSRYFLQRLLLVIPTLVGVVVFLFALVRFLPGDVVDQVGGTFGTGPTEEARREQVRHQLGLDQPAYRQFFSWAGDLLRGDLGESLVSRFPVAQELKDRIPVTAEMAAMALAISLLIALPVGILAAIRQDSLLDYLGRGSAILLLAIPGFWVGTMIIALPNRYWGWSPPLRYVDLWDDPLRNLYTMVFPAAILGVGLAGAVLRLVRAQMLEVLRQDYIRTA
ncbi:MAG TPA: ABC transporter permease, partial [Dehalococcoidia bacterium]|nr:ABC transporter permease [Dehalococcoidia bacterium]